MKDIQNRLHQWYHANKRDLPWRHTDDAYKIWVSEIILQQTQVIQGLPYYYRFTEQYPTVSALAKANEDDILKLWQGLGYYSRARNMHAAAKQVMTDFDGQFPTQYDELLQLKGVGDYTASAVSSFSSGEARACVDGNVIRVICRLFGVDIPYDTSEGQKAIRALAKELLPKDNSATHNQAIMEFGAMQCTPKNTQCEYCIYADKCSVFANNTVTELPIKSKKTKVQNLFLYYIVFQHEGTTLIQQRSDKGIWRKLYEFPLKESETKLSKKDILELVKERCDIENGSNYTFSAIYNHLLSHRKIQATFIHVKTSQPLEPTKDEQLISLSNFEDYPVSRLIERYWQDFEKNI